MSTWFRCSDDIWKPKGETKLGMHCLVLRVTQRMPQEKLRKKAKGLAANAGSGLLMANALMAPNVRLSMTRNVRVRRTEGIPARGDLGEVETETARHRGLQTVPEGAVTEDRRAPGLGATGVGKDPLLHLGGEQFPQKPQARRTQREFAGITPRMVIVAMGTSANLNMFGMPLRRSHLNRKMKSPPGTHPNVMSHVSTMTRHAVPARRVGTSWCTR